jgi:hypothetical protein
VVSQRSLRRADPSSGGVLWMTVFVSVVCCQPEVAAKADS